MPTSESKRFNVRPNVLAKRRRSRPLERRVRLFPTRRDDGVATEHAAECDAVFAEAGIWIPASNRVDARIALNNGEATDRRDRATARAATASPPGVSGASRCGPEMRRVDGAKNNNLTFDLSGVP